MKTLRQSSKEYLNCHHVLGYKMANHGRYLQDFISFMSHKKANHITSKLALEWAQLPKGSTLHTQAIRLGVIRRFAQYHTLTDRRTEVPASKLLMAKYCRPLPHIYSQDEIATLLAAVKSPPRPFFGIEPETLYTMIGLAVSTGLRRSELLKLDIKDVDFCNGILKIGNTKFQKSRMIPVHQSTIKNLQKYYRFRLKQKDIDTNAFFITRFGTRVPLSTLNFAFRRATEYAGLRQVSESKGLRLHDLRHTFAVNALIQLLRSSSSEVDCKIPALSTYLGHINPTTTYWYFSCVPELMRLARIRMERIARLDQ